MNRLTASIIIASFNGEKYIKEQLESILLQMEEEDELIIVDDCSNDRTISIIESLYKDYPNLNTILYSNKNNLGPNKSFEKGLSIASKEIIVLSDQDDIWFHNRLSKIKDILKKHDFCTLNSFHWEHKENELKEDSQLTFNLVRPNKNILKNLIKPTFIGCHLAFKSNFLKYILPFPRFVYMHDLWIGIIAILTKDIFINYEPSMYYRRHINCFTPKKTTLFFKLQCRFRYLITIFIAKARLLDY